MTISRFRATSLLAVVCVATTLSLLPGCGDGRPARVPVSGTVLIDGKPLTTGFIRLYPEGARPATGEIDAQGRFTLTCFEKNDGVMLGTHPVTVIATQTVSATATRWLVPKKYDDPKTSDLKVPIDGPTDSLKVDLTWDGGKPFIEHHKPSAE